MTKQFLFQAINAAGACLCAVYLVFLFFTKQINPADWNEVARWLAAFIFTALFVLCLIVQRGINESERRAKQYFEDNTQKPADND